MGIYLIVLLLLLLIIAFLIVLHHRERKLLIKLMAEKKEVEISRDSSLEYIDALWQSQKNLIIDEKMISMNSLIAKIAHELNTPLGVILTAVSHVHESVKSSDGNVDASDLLPMLDLSMMSLHKSIDLVNMFTEISRAGSNEEAKPVRILEFIDFVSCGVKCPDIEYDIKENFLVNISQYGLSVILKKILDNAYEFSSKDGNVAKIVIVAEKKGSTLIVKVRDNGIGIKKGNLKNIFDPFYTTRDDDEHYGLGLAVAYNLLSRDYNGNMTCKSEEGVGTEVTVTVPDVIIETHDFIKS